MRAADDFTAANDACVIQAIFQTRSYVCFSVTALKCLVSLVYVLRRKRAVLVHRQYTSQAQMRTKHSLTVWSLAAEHCSWSCGNMMSSYVMLGRTKVSRVRSAAACCPWALGVLWMRKP